MRTADWVHLSLITAIGVACAHRGLAVRRHPGDLAVRALFLALLALFFAFLLGLPQVYWPVFRWWGEVPALPQLVQHVLTMAVTYHAGTFMALVASPAGVDRALRRRVLAGGLVLLVACYLAGPFRLGLPTLGPSGQPDVGVTLYVLVWQGYLVVTLVDITRIWWRRKVIERRFLRVGVTMMAIGAMFGLVEAVHKVAYQVVANAGGRLPWQENGPGGVQVVLLTPVVVLITIGITLPSWGPRVDLWAARRRVFRRLTPLADAIGAACPEVVPHRYRRGARARVQQRVIGIRDALIGPLRPYLDAVDENAERAVAEARCIAEAIHRKGTGVEVGGPPPEFATGDDLDSDAAWLAQVSTAYREAFQSLK